MNTPESTTEAAPQGVPAFSMVNMMYVAQPLGTIRIGYSRIAEDGSLSPVASDEFRVTQPMRDEQGEWIPDPIDQELRAAKKNSDPQFPQKLLDIPVKVLFDDPKFAVRARFQAFDANGRSVCSSNGNGLAFRETGTSAQSTVQCVGCDKCSFARADGIDCKLLGRILVQIDGQASPLGQYVFRTGSINTLRSVETNLRAYHALFAGRLRGVPFKLKLRPMQSQQSNWQTFQTVDLELNGVTVAEALAIAKKQSEYDSLHGLNYEAMGAVIQAGLENGCGSDDAVHSDGADLSEFFQASRFAKTYCEVDLPTQTGDTSGGAAATGEPQADPHPASLQTAQVGDAKPVQPHAQTPRTSVGRSAGVSMPEFSLPVEKPLRNGKTGVTAERKDVTSMSSF